MTIRKATIKVVVLYDDTLTGDPTYNPDTLGQVVYDLEEGVGTIGSWDVVRLDDVPDGQVQNELLAIGNDGGFFDEDWGT